MGLRHGNSLLSGALDCVDYFYLKRSGDFWAGHCEGIYLSVVFGSLTELSLCSAIFVCGDSQ
jgi:hypothetical protein